MMIVALAALLAAPLDTAATVPRKAFAACLKQATAQAQTQQVASAGFEVFARSQCASTEETFKKAVMAIDIRHGVSRKDAAENAKLELDDYYVMASEHFAAMTPAPK